MSFDYYGSRWKKKREHILRLDGYKDQLAKRKGRNVEAKIVHHIYPAELFPQFAWEDWNLISVSMGTHNALENRATGELSVLGEKLMKETKPGFNWRKRNEYSTLPPGF